MRYLDALPRGLKNAYDKIYRDLANRESSWKEVADRAFQWLSCSYRPLSLQELLAAVCQDPDAPGTSAVDIDVDFVLEACHNLITVVDATVARGNDPWDKVTLP